MNNRTLAAIFATVFAFAGLGGERTAAAGYPVDVFIGTDAHASFNPAALWPNGMLQPGPVTSVQRPMHTTSYRYGATTVVGFDQNRGMGTLWPSLHDVLVMPFTGDLLQMGGDPAAERPPVGTFDKADEAAEPGYYRVDIRNYGVRAELTAAERVAFHRYTFAKAGTGRVYVDLQAGPMSGYGHLAKPPRVFASESRVEENRRLVGVNHVRCYVADREVHYALEFSRAADRVTELPSNGYPAKRYVFDFAVAAGEAVELRVALSGVDEAGAKLNLATADGNFDTRRAAAAAAWAKVFARVEVEGTAAERTLYYSMLYQAYAQPTRMDDADGRVRIAKDAVVRTDRPWYSGFLDCWDTFRAAHPFYTILTPSAAGDFARTLLEHSIRLRGPIPSNTMFAHAQGVMGGHYGVAIVLDAWEKGLLPEYSAAQVFGRAVATHGVSAASEEVKRGYVPFDGSRSQVVSSQLDNATTSQLICEFARRHGIADARVELYAKCGGSWRGIYDPETGWIRPRKPDGTWYEHFRPFDQRQTAEAKALGHQCAWNEGAAAQWSWMVLSEPEAFVAAHGGKAKAAADLDRIFNAPADLKVVRGYGCTGQLGQYYHGNEPTHHMPYYYLYMDRGDRTDEIVRDICTKLYRVAPDGICGDCDSGQMAAWYLMSAAGLYQFKPVGGEILLGAPQLPKVVLHLSPDAALAVVAKGLSKANKYVKSVTFRGRRLAARRIDYRELMKGGELVFEMGPGEKDMR